MPTPPDATHAAIIATTEAWLEKAVIGLNLCPFAKAVHIKKQIRIVVCDADTPEQLLSVLMDGCDGCVGGGGGFGGPSFGGGK